ncbi:MAG: hypothetical protein PSX71_08195 [bacterium]|nr:hypothetical protein [bacterium]
MPHSDLLLASLALASTDPIYLSDALKIAHELSKIESAIRDLTSSNSSSYKPFFIAASGALAGAISGYLSNFFHWKRTEKERKISDIIDQIDRLLDNLEKEAISYWLMNFSEDKSADLYSLEIQIKADLRLLTMYSKLLKLFLKKEKSINLHSALTEIISQLYDAITGGSFESIEHIASKPDAMKISSKFSSARQKLITIVATR